jgi:hypothetical protein
MTEKNRSSICLDIAIDHRLFPLFQPLHAANSKSESNHVHLLQNMARTLRHDRGMISTAEVATAQDLAGPPTKGGICFVLQQPADNHPYHLGTESVIELSPTLSALLLDLWPIVSCGAPRPTVIDRLPFVRPSDRTDYDCNSRIQERIFAMVQEKKLSVVVCMWRRNQNMGDMPVDNPRSMRAIEGLGVGRTFNSPYCELRPGCNTQRVNAFHPGFTVNYQPHLSCLRQLLILEVAHACGLHRGLWRNEIWMDELREYCQAKVREISASGKV